MPADSPASPVTAVGRLLQPKHGEPRIRRIVAIEPGGRIRTVVNRPLTAA
jgi:hypothetical protein